MKQRFLVLCLAFSFLLSTAETRRVLFIGNSYTYVNNLPLLLDSLARSAGDTVVFDSSTPGGYTFQLHSSNATTLAKIAQGNWDVVVLQEQSQLPSFPDPQVQASVFPYARILDSLVHVYSPCATTLFYRTWGRKNGDASNCANFPPLCTYAGMDSLLHLRYLTMADSNRAALCPAGQVWKRIRSLHPGIELYQSDESHPSLAGSYVTACAFYASIFRKNPLTLSYNPGLPDSVVQVARLNASQVVYDSLLTWNTGRWDVRAGALMNVSGTTVSFTDTSQNALQIQWNMGDGTVYTTSNITHTYSAPGVYTAMQVASDGCMQDTTIFSVSAFGVGLQQTSPADALRWFCPSQGMLLLYPGEAGGFLQLFEATGKAVLSQQLSVTEVLQCTNLKPGLYILRQTGPGGKILTEKISVP